MCWQKSTFSNLKLLLFLICLGIISCSEQIIYRNSVTPFSENNLIREIHDTMTRTGTYGKFPRFYFWKNNVYPIPHYNEPYYLTTDDLTVGGNRLIHDLRYCQDINTNCEDRFSAVLTKQQADELSANVAVDKFGFRNHIYTDNGVLYLYVLQVFPNSPFSLNGVRRGDRIVKMNGYDATLPSHETTLKNLLYNPPGPVIFVFRNLAGTEYQLTISRENYTTSDIINTDDRVASDKSYRFHSTVMMVTNPNNANQVKKVGYLLYDGYTSRSRLELKELMAYWNSKDITNQAIIDLRYNGGGYVETARILGSLLTTNYTTSDFFSRLIYNDLFQNINSTYQFSLNEEIELSLTNATGQSFKQAYSSQHNFKNLYFLVSGSSASASEMTITALKPFLNVVIIGEKTSGKGVGQSPYLDITGQYQIRMINFRYYNSRGEGVPHTGLIPNILAKDDNVLPFGHGEPLFEEAVRKIFNLPPKAPQGESISSTLISSSDKNKPHSIRKKELDWYKNNYHRLVGF